MAPLGTRSSVLASLLPGLRELRAPLAAGYVWLLFGYLVAGSPSDVTRSGETLGDLLAALQDIGGTATVVALSFAAYLVGSVSQDAFGHVVPAGIRRLARSAPRNPTALDGHVVAAVDDIREYVSAARSQPGDRDTAFPTRNLESLLRFLIQMLGELRLAGASEAEKPEALRPMVEAEEKLRIAVVPPLTAVMAYLVVAEHPLWLVGLLFTAALFWQAVTRRVEAVRLAERHHESRATEVVETGLQKVLDDVERGAPRETIAKKLAELPLGRLERIVRL